MKKKFKLEGLDCANCAAKIERGVKEIDGVKEATVNFMMQKLMIEGDDDKMASIIEAAERIIKKVEPDVEMKKA